MDHLLGPKALARYSDSLDEIPWFGLDDGPLPQVSPSNRPQQSVAGSSFLSYPNLRGFTDWDLGQIPWSQFHEERTLSMLQSWMFFGLWESVLKLSLSHDTFIQLRHGQKILRTHALRPIVRSVIENAAQLSNLEVASLISHVQSICHHANKLYTNLALHQDTDSFDLSVTQSKQVDVILRMSILSLEYIEISVLQRLLASSVYRSDASISNNHRISIEQKLQNNNWCSLSWEYMRKLNYSSAEFASLIYRRGAPNQHTKCSQIACIARNVDDYSAIPAHTSSHCRCKFWSPPLPRLFEVLGQRDIALLSVAAILDSDAPPRRKIVSYKRGMRYTAFSHLWADGLGSTSEKGLPLCQLRRLCDKVETDFFWIDALCIPQDETFRKASIQSMAKIYQEAEIVLVLDASLQEESSTLLDMEELVIKILTSDWNQRLWTLQEAALSKILQFECKDSRLHLNTLLSQFTPSCDAYYTPLACLFEMLKSFSVARNSSMTVHGIGDGHPSDRAIFNLGMTINLLSNRSSSRLSDEPFAIAPLLGVDVTSLTDQIGEGRMEKLFLGVGNVTTKAVFSHSHKLEKEGFRWAPKSLIDSGGDYGLFLELDKFPGVVTEHGLRGEQLIMMLEQELLIDTAIDTDYRLRSTDAEWEYLLAPFPDIEGVPEKHPIMAIAICADFGQPLSSENLYDAIGLRSTGIFNDNGVPVYALEGHFMLMGPNRIAEDSGDDSEQIQAVHTKAAEVLNIIIS